MSSLILPFPIRTPDQKSGFRGEREAENRREPLPISPFSRDSLSSIHEKTLFPKSETRKRIVHLTLQKRFFFSSFVVYLGRTSFLVIITSSPLSHTTSPSLSLYLSLINESVTTTRLLQKRRDDSPFSPQGPESTTFSPLSLFSLVPNHPSKLCVCFLLLCAPSDFTSSLSSSSLSASFPTGP